MRRATDRIEALLRLVLLALLVIGGPVAGTYAGQTACASGMQSARAQSMAWHRVPGLILRVKPIAMLRQHPARTGPATLSVRWTPQGSPRSGEMVGRADAAPGHGGGIDKAGRLNAPPLSLIR